MPSFTAKGLSCVFNAEATLQRLRQRLLQSLTIPGTCSLLTEPKATDFQESLVFYTNSVLEESLQKQFSSGWAGTTTLVTHDSSAHIADHKIQPSKFVQSSTHFVCTSLLCVPAFFLVPMFTYFVDMTYELWCEIQSWALKVGTDKVADIPEGPEVWGNCWNFYKLF